MSKAPERLSPPDATRALPALEVEVHADGREPPRLRLRGEIDILSVPVLHKSLSALVEEGGDVVVDLTEVAFIGLAGVEALCSHARCLRQRGDRLVVSSASPITRRVIDIIGVGDLLSVADEGPG